ncbi:hypothetical protein NDU88_002666 [Pleurodeles waltl]|uniref:Uncharacterized protein n=1 Tax=Pleurodeles waltl TaxID=8319 RepID=A0AAV7W005_PLEWA|nr:hypothetical protein NDU88_002666 [Pleurodeles waltl]
MVVQPERKGTTRGPSTPLMIQSTVPPLPENTSNPPGAPTAGAHRSGPCTHPHGATNRCSPAASKAAGEGPGGPGQPPTGALCRGSGGSRAPPPLLRSQSGVPFVGLRGSAAVAVPSANRPLSDSALWAHPARGRSSVSWAGPHRHVGHRGRASPTTPPGYHHHRGRRLSLHDSQSTCRNSF